jgi:uncharacterized protein YkwD
VEIKLSNTPGTMVPRDTTVGAITIWLVLNNRARQRSHPLTNNSPLAKVASVRAAEESILGFCTVQPPTGAKPGTATYDFSRT